MRSKLRLEFDKQLEEQARVLSDTESPIGLFWQAIHRTFQGFPRIRPELEEDPAEDTTVGPCVLGPKLGHGTFGKVHMAEDMRTGELEAIKVISKDRRMRCPLPHKRFPLSALRGSSGAPALSVVGPVVAARRWST